MNELIKIYEAYPKESWSMKNLAANPNITLECMDTHPIFLSCNSKYSRYGIESNPNLTIDFILNHPDVKWDWYTILSNPNIDLNDIDILKEMNVLDVTSQNYWENLALNPNITLDFILQNKKHFKDQHISKNLGASPNITLQNIIDHRDLFWHNWQISQNPNITLDFVFNNWNSGRGNWVFKFIARMPLITFQDVLRYPALFHHYSFMDHLALNPNITLDIILNNRSYKWDHKNIIKNSSVSLQDIKEIKYMFKQNYGIKELYINNYYEALSLNPNLTAEYVVSHKKNHGHFMKCL